MVFKELLADAEYLTETTAQMVEELEGIGAFAKRRLNPSAHSSIEELADAADRIQTRLEKSQNLLGMLDKHLTDITELKLETDQEIQKLQAELLKLKSPDEIKRITERLDELQKQSKKLGWMYESASKMKDQFREQVDQTGQILHDVHERQSTLIQNAQRKRAIIKSVMTAPVKVGFNTAKGILSGANKKVNPLEKKVNKHDTSDHGVESLRLANSAVKTVSNTVKTTTRTVKTMATAPKKAYQLVKGTVQGTYRVTRAVVHTTGTILIHTVAFVMNPIILVLVLILLFVVLCAAFVAQAANISGTEQNETIVGGYSDAIGVGDIETIYPDAANYYQIACNNNKAAFGSKIDSLYYSASNLKNSDLVYMERNLDGAITTYTKGFASDTYKGTLKSAWSITIPEKEAVAIAYIYLEKQQNDAHGTAQVIYDVTFTQDVFDLIVNTAVKWTDATYNGQECPSKNCSLHNDQHLNPAYTTALNAYNQAVNAKNDWNTNVKPKSDAYISALANYNSVLATYNSTPAAGKPFIEPTLNSARDAMNTAFAYFNQAVTNWCSVFHYSGLTVNESLDATMQTTLTNAVNSAQTTLNNTQQYITSSYRTCDHLHKLHSIGLYGYSKEAVMNTLGFSDEYKEWEALTEFGLNSNPNI